MKTLILVSSISLSVVVFVLFLHKIYSEWYLSDLDKKLRDFKELEFLVMKHPGDGLLARSYRLITDGTKQCLFVAYDTKGFYTFFYDMQGYICDESTYYEYGDMPHRPGEPAEDCGIIR